MTLGFSLEINGRPTYFPEKIIVSMGLPIEKYQIGYLNSITFKGSDFKKFKNPKLHTIRTDEKRRWKAGMDIHAVIHNRTPKRLQFLPTFKCTGVQEISINPTHRTILVEASIYGLKSWKAIFEDDIEQLAINDGFDSVEDFWSYFKEPFEGVIIHWTNKRY